METSMTEFAQHYSYIIMYIDCSMLDEERATLNLMQFDTVTGSSSFHGMVFSPGKDSFKASKLIGISDKCKVNYGQCFK